MNNVARHCRAPSQTKDHKTASLWCMFMSCSLCSFYFLHRTPQTHSALVLLLPSTLNPITSPSRLHHSTLSPLLLLLLCLQARMPSRRSGLSPGTSLWGWEPQLCWGVRCCGPRGLCSGWKMASSWDLREACQALNATAWLETPREVNRDTLGIRSPAYWALMDLFVLHRWTCLIKASLKDTVIYSHASPTVEWGFQFDSLAENILKKKKIWWKRSTQLNRRCSWAERDFFFFFLNCLQGKMNNYDVERIN